MRTSGGSSMTSAKRWRGSKRNSVSADYRGHRVASADESSAAQSQPSEAPRLRGRIRRVFSGSRALVRIVYRDPEHVAERLTLYAIDRLGAASGEWAQAARTVRPDAPAAQLGEELRKRSAQIARIDGAISGTPFFIALVPGYVSYLWQEMRMTLRIAALFGRDPSHLRTAGEMLALRGMHPSIETAEAALGRVRETAMPDRPTARRPLRTWVHSVYLLLVFGGFLSPSATKPPKRGAMDRVKAVFSLLLGVAIWVTTWVLPVTFMILMAWGCQTHARQLGRRALVFYAGEAATVDAAIIAADQRRDRGHDKRAILRAVALFLSVAIPIAFIAYADHVEKTTRVSWVGALGALVALSLVIATAVISSRR
jgi:hypothetical protein